MASNLSRLDPKDYRIWSMMSAILSKGRTTVYTEEELNKAIQNAWERITVQDTGKSTSSWKKDCAQLSSKLRDTLIVSNFILRITLQIFDVANW